MTLKQLAPVLALIVGACAAGAPEPAPTPAPVAAAAVTDGCPSIVALFLAAPETTSVTKVAEPVKLDPAPFKRPYPRGVIGRDRKASIAIAVAVDTLGRADMKTFKVVNTTHPWLATSLKTAIAKWKFTPAEINGCKVPRTYHFGATVGQ